MTHKTTEWGGSKPFVLSPLSKDWIKFYSTQLLQSDIRLQNQQNKENAILSNKKDIQSFIKKLVSLGL